MKLIVGLGNPGGEYKDTRHNIGFMVVEKLAKELGSETVVWEEKDRFKSVIARIGEVLLVKPVIFMNNSGLAVSSIVHFYKLNPDDVWVVHDDIDLPLGKIRIRTGGGSAGHNGIESIIKELKSDAFVRFRMGIGRGKLFGHISKDTRDEDEHFRKEKRALSQNRMYRRSIVDFVLSRFSQGEAGSLKHLIKNGTEAVRIALIEGVDKAMGRFN
jgi:PTH1 family peptidyl-tRNA hydrolase